MKIAKKSTLSNLIFVLFLSRWRKEGNCLLKKQQKQIEKQQQQIDEQQKQLENQSRLLKLVAKATGIEVEES